MTADVRPSARRWMWLAAVMLMVAQFLVFDRMTSQHHASVYPRWNDQIQYLRESYTAYEQAQTHGLAAGLKFTLTKPALQGTLHDFFALLAFRVVGSASRSAALSLNLLVFLVWQATLLAVISRLSRSAAVGWMGFGLLLCVAWPWSAEAASAVDFRLDHGAMCLMGITACVALLTGGFRHLGWSVVFGLAVGVTLLERFLTGAYFAVIFFATAVWILGGDAKGLRWRNLLLAALTAAVLAGPMFWFNRTTIYNYYWVGHVAGAEAAARLRAMDHWGAVKFVFGNLAGMQLGRFFGWVVAVLTVLLLALAALLRKPAAGSGPGRDWLFFALAFLLLPGAVLWVHPQKSEFVLGVLVPGAVLLVLWIWAILWQRIDFSAGRSWRRLVPIALALGAVGAGETYFVSRQLAPAHSPEFLASARKVNVIADYIYASAHAAHLPNPVIGVDQIVDFLDAQILEVVCYERHKVWTPYAIELPQGILGEKDDLIFYRLKTCDYFFLTDSMPGDGYWPYDKQMLRLYPQLKQWCEAHLRRVQTFDIFGRQITLYQRPEIPRSLPAASP